jgi:hypothetical protein
MSTLGSIPLNVLLGVPDPVQRIVRVSPDGRRLLRLKPGVPKVLIGSVNLARHLDPQRFALERFYLQKGAGLRLRIGPGPILNHIADADTCSGALEVAARIVGQISRPCFNRPASVARTTRHEVAHVLAGIPGLTVPKTIRAQNTAPSRVREAITQAGLAFPVLLRGVGTHGGMSLIKADSAEDVEGARPQPPRREVYVTEFRDFRSPDGRYRKFRVVVVGGEIFLRHCIIADNWILHATRRAAETEELESAMFKRFEAEWRSQVQPVFREIATRLSLDFFGVDCNIDENGRVLLFEANACMNILKNTSPSPNMWDAPISRIKSAVEQRLASPSTWFGSVGA